MQVSTPLRAWAERPAWVACWPSAAMTASTSPARMRRPVGSDQGFGGRVGVGAGRCLRGTVPRRVFLHAARLVSQTTLRRAPYRRDGRASPLTLAPATGTVEVAETLSEVSGHLHFVRPRHEPATGVLACRALWSIRSPGVSKWSTPGLPRSSLPAQKGAASPGGLPATHLASSCSCRRAPWATHS
jgi:hypothetical protein